MCDQSVTNGQQDIVFCRHAKRQIVLNHSNNQAANNVDEQNENPSDGVSSDKFTRTIHGPIEICLARNIGSSPARFVLRDHASIHICVDGHLLTGHRV